MFKFVNQTNLPKPRAFKGDEKLYPSGRGSSIPLNLALFQ
jgi:WAS/WASL-interacting protein